MGIATGNSQHKISAYADYLLFSLTNPVVSLSNLIREFEIYGALSNLKIIFDKSAAMGVKIAPTLLTSLNLLRNLNGRTVLLNIWVCIFLVI